jgi:hypothetical protein
MADLSRASQATSDAEMRAFADAFINVSVVQLGPSPGYLAGLAPALQTVTVQVTELRTGQGLQVGDTIDLGVALVASAPYVSLSGDVPTLDTTLFRPGAAFAAYVVRLDDAWIAFSVDIDLQQRLAGRRLGGGSLARTSNDPPRQGRNRTPASNVSSSGQFPYVRQFVPNNEITFEFAALGVEPDDPSDFVGPVDGEVTVVLGRVDGTELGRCTTIIKDQQRAYATFTGSQSDPIEASVNYTVTVYNRISPSQTLTLRMWVWT